MSANYTSILALTAAVVFCADSSPAGDDNQPHPKSGAPALTRYHSIGDVDDRPDKLNDLSAPREFQNLVTDDAALEAWLALGPPQREIILDGRPLNEVARNTARMFKNQFDLILPTAVPDLPPMALHMGLKDVRAIDVFNALNLYFEAQKIPARWKLTLNGTRPTAILGIEGPLPAAPPPAGTEKIGQTVFPIPDILCASSAGADQQTASHLEETIVAALNDLQKPGHAGVNAPGGPVVKVHEPAGILVCSGTWTETELVRSTLQALKDTAQERKAAAHDRDLRAKDEAARN